MRLPVIAANLAVAGLVAASLGAVCGAQAAERHATLSGSRLAIDSPCARSVDVQPDPGLHGQVLVTASAEHEEELDHLALDGGETVRLLTQPGECWRAGLFGAWRPTLRLAVRVPEGFDLRIDESSIGAYTLGAVGGRLALGVSGTGDVSAQSATDLDVELSGLAHIRVAAVRGAVKIDLSGGGAVALGSVAAPTLVAELSGAGALSVDGGQIGRATTESSGVGTIQIGAVVGSAHADLSGMGSVRFARVTGQLDKEVSGMGSVTVGQ